MRLLYGSRASGFSLTKELHGKEIPSYAILSHTWGKDEDEVTFNDIQNGTAVGKPGYQKLLFCAEQAARESVQHFWIDSCCINKANGPELQEAICSMFNWYHDAVKCFVYLTDVSRTMSGSRNGNGEHWESALYHSRWFTRGWTLQELLAPTYVDFFSREGQKLGTKQTLEPQLCEITGIPARAFRESSFANFSISERLSWQERRETKREEDKAYSLLGIFDIQIPLFYGEGRERAFRRLREELDRALKGIKREDFSVTFSLSEVYETGHFVSRDEELAEIHRSLLSDGGRRTIVLHGLGGIGKTQLTVAYAKRHRDSYSATFWINITDENSLKQSFLKVAKQILREHPTARWLNKVDLKGDLDGVVEAVKSWLSQPGNTRWLMIYDNYDNPKIYGNNDPAAVDIHKYLPDAYQGSVIITTRSSQVRIGHSLQIKGMKNLGDSLEILSHTSGRNQLKNDPNAIKLAEKLEGFPLALATAGAYLNQVTTTFSDYLRLYEESWSKLLQFSPEVSSYKDRTLYSTWDITFRLVKQRNELAAELLQLWAYFHNQDIWFELLRTTKKEDPEWLRELTKDELSFNSAMRVLCDHGLVEANASWQPGAGSRGYSMHGCVHSWTVHVLNQNSDGTLAKSALRRVALHINETEDIDWWIVQTRLLPHATRCLYIVEHGLVPEKGMAWAYYNLGNLFTRQGSLREAEDMYLLALKGYESGHGPKSKLTLDTVHNLGLVYKLQKKLDESETMYLRALEGMEETHGLNHLTTLNAVNNLANLYVHKRKFTEAEDMYMRALHGREKALGPKHTLTLDVVNNLGTLYEYKGELLEAEKMYARALRGYEEVLDSDKIDTNVYALNKMENLAGVLAKMGRKDESKVLFLRAQNGFKLVFGPSSKRYEDVTAELAKLELR